MKVLIIEDNEDLRFTLAEAIESFGHDVEFAEDGNTGLAKLIALAPDVAFVDIGLPDMDGYEIAQRLRRVGKRTFLVALSGYGEATAKDRAAAAGFDTHLTKPAGIAELRAALDGHDLARSERSDHVQRDQAGNA